MSNPTSPIREKQATFADSVNEEQSSMSSTRTINYAKRDASTRDLQTSDVIEVFARKEITRPQRTHRRTGIKGPEIISTSTSSSTSPRSKKPSKENPLEHVQRRKQRSKDFAPEAPEENENLQKQDYELIPTNFKAPNLVDPEHKKLISFKIEEHKKYHQDFIDALEKPYPEDKFESVKQDREIEIARNKMVHSADNVIGLVSKDKTIDSIDFLQSLTLIVQMSDLLRPKFFVQKSDLFKIGKQNPLEVANKNLKALLLIDFANCRHDPRVIEVLGLHKKDPLFSGIASGINGDIERKKREITILYEYSKALRKLAENLEFASKNLRFPELDPKSNQKMLLDKIDLYLDQIIHIVKKHDEREVELKKFLDKDDYRGWEGIIYTSIAQMIKGQVIDKFWVEKYIETEKELIQLHSNKLSKGNYRSAFFYDACRTEFDDHLLNQKCDLEFIVWMRRAVGAEMFYYIDPNRKVILRPREMPEIDNPNEEELKAYNKRLGDYEQASMVLFSERVFDEDGTYLPNFFQASVGLIQEWMPQLLKKPETSKDDKSPGVAPDALEIHTAIFTFLGILQKPTREFPAALIDKILDDFQKKLSPTNEELSSTNEETLKKLEEKFINETTLNKLKEKAINNKRNDLPVKMTIEFLLHFYRCLDHKIIMVPVDNLTKMYQLMYPKHGDILKKQNLDKETAKRIYICPTDMGFVIENVRVDEINLGLDPELGNDEDETLRLLLNTCTRVSWDYASDAAAKNAIESKKKVKELKEFTNSIEFSYQVVKPKISLAERINNIEREKEAEKAKAIEKAKGSLTQIQEIKKKIENEKEVAIDKVKEIDREIEKAKEERIKLFTLLIDAAGYPRFDERYW